MYNRKTLLRFNTRIKTNYLFKSIINYNHKQTFFQKRTELIITTPIHSMIQFI